MIFEMVFCITSATFAYQLQSRQDNIVCFIVPSIFKKFSIVKEKLFCTTMSPGCTFSGWSILCSEHVMVSLSKQFSRLNFKCILCKLQSITFNSWQLSHGHSCQWPRLQGYTIDWFARDAGPCLVTFASDDVLGGCSWSVWCLYIQ